MKKDNYNLICEKIFSKKSNFINLYKKYFGKNSSFLQDGIKWINVDSKLITSPNIIISDTPKFQNLYFRKKIIEKKINFHIGGYSTDFFDAFYRLLGESIERYASISFPLISNFQVFLGTYKELSKKHKIIPLKYINIYSDQQYIEMHKINNSISNSKLKIDDKINWILIDGWWDREKTKFLIPECMIFSTTSCDKNFNPLFSTGTATHLNYEKAIENAVCEAVQIDLFMKSWYLNIEPKFLLIDDYEIKNFINGFLDDSEFSCSFFWIFNKDLKIHVVWCVIKNKKNIFPKYSVGIQGSLNIEESIKRSFLEAIACVSFCTGFDLNLFSQKMNYKLFKKCLNLDDNVLYYGIDPDNVFRRKINMWEKSNKLKLSEILKNNIEKTKLSFKKIISIFKYFSVIDITPIEFSDDYKVVKIFAPELLSMCFPGFFPENHAATRGKNTWNFPHPLP